MSLKILWVSNPPWANSGYAKTTKNVVPALKAAGHDVSILADWGLFGNSIDWKGIKVYPAKLPVEGGTENSVTKATIKYLPKLMEKEKFDVAVIHMDIWSCNSLFTKFTIPWISYAPIDSEPMSPLFFDCIQTAKKVVTFSKFANNLMNKSSVTNTLIPHGVDTSIYKPTKDKSIFRKKFNIPEDVFLFTICGINRGARKGLHNMMEAYGRFLASNPEAREKTRLYLHTDVAGFDHGFNMINVCQLFDTSENCIFTSPEDYSELSDMQIADLFRASDVLLQCSHSEGFGYPVLEAGACGVPAIVTDYTSLPELVEGHGVKVRVACKELQPQNYNYSGIPFNADIVQGMETYYKNKTLLKKHGENAAFDAKDNYDWGKEILPKWRKFFEEYEKESKKVK